MVFETLGSVNNLQIQEGAGDGLIRMSGVFGVCGVKNGNNRIYDKANYAKMVEALQKQIMTEGCPGELEHPNSMNIDLNNVSHKIESIEMNEDGTVTGTVVLLNTHKGKDAQAMVEGGLPLYISSRGAGSIDESGRVTLSTIKTYDLVGTPGFAQAKLSLKKNQTFECLNESLEDGNIMYAIVESEEEPTEGLMLEEGKKEEKPAEEPKEGEEGATAGEEPKEEPKDEPKGEEPKEDGEEGNKEENNTEKVDMNEIKETIDKLVERVASLEASLHVAQESLEAKEAEIAKLNEAIEAIEPTNYAAIQQWMSEEFAPEFKNEVVAEANEAAQNWVIGEFAPFVEGWVNEEFAPQVENWVNEEFAPVVEKWVNEEFAAQVENWVSEELTPDMQNWVVNEAVTPAIAEAKTSIVNEVNANVSAYMESKKNEKFDNIDKMLEALENSKNDVNVQKALESVTENKYKGVHVVENMPAEYRPSWEMLNEARQQEIIRSSRMYDFTKKGVMEAFWASVKFENETPIVESVQPTYRNDIISQMKKLRNI